MLLALALLLLFAVAVGVSVNRYLNVREARLPDVVGLGIEGAYRTLRASGFEVTSYPEEVDGAPPDSVTSQTPEPGVVVRRGRSVSIGVHTPATDGRVPALVGDTLEVVERRLSDFGLRLGEVVYEHSSEPRGRVLAQTPAAGAAPATGGSVNVTVSRGPEPARISMPDLGGLSVSGAETQLRELGFSSIETVPSSLSYDRANAVNAHSPGAGERVSVSTPVTLYYAASARNFVRVPDVRGHSLANAQEVLRAAGLNVVREWVSYTNDPAQPAGVIAINPTGYTAVGTPVSLTVNGAAGGNTLVEGSAGDFADFSDASVDASTASGTRTIPIRFDPSAQGFLQGDTSYAFKLVVNDAAGERVAIDEVLSTRSQVDTSVQVSGDANLQLFVNDILFLAWSP